MHSQQTRQILPHKMIKSRPCHLVFKLAASAQLLEPHTANSMAETFGLFRLSGTAW